MIMAALIRWLVGRREINVIDRKRRCTNYR